MCPFAHGKGCRAVLAAAARRILRLRFLRGAEAVAEQRISDPRDRERPLTLVREPIAKPIHDGKPIPDVRLRVKPVHDREVDGAHARERARWSITLTQAFPQKFQTNLFMAGIQWLARVPQIGAVLP